MMVFIRPTGAPLGVGTTLGFGPNGSAASLDTAPVKTTVLSSDYILLQSDGALVKVLSGTLLAEAGGGTGLQEWTAGPVSAVSGAVLSNGTLTITSAGYTLPVATLSTLGGVKVDGTTVTINGAGVISAPGGGAQQWTAGAVSAISGGVVSGGTLTISGGGGYTLPAATTSTLGGVKVDGTTVTISGAGVISAPGGGAQQWSAGNVSAIGGNLVLSGGTLNATSGSGGAVSGVPPAVAAAPTDTVVMNIGGVTEQITLAAFFALQSGAAVTVTPSNISGGRVYQRDTRTGNPSGFATTYNRGWGAVSFTVNLSQAMSGATLQMRLRDANSPATVLQDWITVLSGSLSTSNTFSVNVPASTHMYLADFCVNGWTAGAATVGGTAASNSTGASISSAGLFGVGEVVAIAGQSLAVALMSGNAGDISAYLTTPPGNAGPAFGGAVVSPYTQAWWTPGLGAATPFNSAFAGMFPFLVAAGAGVVSGLTGYPVSGVSITTYAPGQTNNTTLKAVITNSGGKFGTFIWLQGNTDAVAGMSAATYQSALAAIIADLQTSFPATTLNVSGTAQHFTRIITTITGDGASNYPPGYVAAIRAGAMAYVASDPLALHVGCLDIQTLSDLTHPTPWGCVGFAREYYRALMQLIGLSQHAAGPKIVSASRASGSAVVKLAIQQDGGTALNVWQNVNNSADNAGDAAAPLTPAIVSASLAANQFQLFANPTVFASGALSSTPLTISSVAIISATEIDITLSAAPSDSTAVDVWYRLTPDTTAQMAIGIYDNYGSSSDGDSFGFTWGRQLQVAPAAITAAAPASAVTPNAPTVAYVSSTYNSITISITPSGVGIPVSYTVSYTTGGTTLTQTFAASGMSVANATITGLTAATSYTINATATNGSGTSGNSNTVTQSTPTETVTLTQPANQTVGAAFTVAGTYTNALPTALDYSLDGGTTWSAASSPTIGGGTYSFSLTIGSANASQTLKVRDHTSGVASATSAAFSVTVGQIVTVSTPASQATTVAFTVGGTYSNGTPTALDYSLNGGTTWTAAPSPTISGGIYTFSITIGTANASQTIKVRDHSTLVSGTSGSFVVATPTLSLTAPGSASASSTLAISGTYTAAAPTGMTATISGSATITGFSAAGNVWNATVATPASAGTYTLTVTGTGPNTGTASQSITVTAAAFSAGVLDGMTASPLGAWSLRRLRVGYTANKAVQLTLSSAETVTQDIGFTSTGDFDAASAIAFAAGATAYVSKWYDQSGNGLDLTSASSDLPRLVFSGAVYKIGSGTGYAITLNGDASAGFQSASVTPGAMTAFTANAVFAGGASSGSRLLTFTSGGTDASQPGVIALGASSGSSISAHNAAGWLSTGAVAGSTTLFIASSVFAGAGANHTMYVNGTAQTAVSEGSSATIGGAAGNWTLGVTGGYGVGWSTAICEAFIFGSALSGTDRQTLEHSQESYFAITGI